MKARLKNWITSIIGVLLMVLGSYLIFEKYPENYIYISFGIGLALLFAKDTLVKKLINKF